VGFEIICPANTHQANARFFQKVPTPIPTGYLAGYFVKVIRGFIHNVPTGHIGGYLVGYIMNEIREFVHNVPTGYWGGYLPGKLFQNPQLTHNICIV